MRSSGWPLPLHKHDYKNPGDKEGPLTDLRAKSFEPGVYMVPWCHGKEKDPATADKMKAARGQC